jgi:hypothetical protein
MKAYISKGSGIGRENGFVKFNPTTDKIKPGQFHENRIIQKDTKHHSSTEGEECYADVFFIFNFPQRKIRKALKRSK